MRLIDYWNPPGSVSATLTRSASSKQSGAATKRGDDMNEPAPEYTPERYESAIDRLAEKIEPEPEYTPAQVEHAFDNSMLLVRVLKTEIYQLRGELQACEAANKLSLIGVNKALQLRAELQTCRKERDAYQAVSVRLLGELKAAQDGTGYAPGRIVSADDWLMDDEWSQQE